ncbi:MAG: hypothetical protein KGH69_00770 [Candidatus Micrarchaeota archaeon]|nr:hypothetical protein [Candidatus Micrarchaeota archaeon]
MDMIALRKYMNYIFLLVTAGSMFAGLASAAASTSISQQLCGIVDTIRSIIGILALLLFIAGGALYAVAHVMPAAGNLKGNLQGWSVGMIVGGVVGLIIVLTAPWVLSSIIGFAGGKVSVPKC